MKFTRRQFGTVATASTAGLMLSRVCPGKHRNRHEVLCRSRAGQEHPSLAGQA